MPDFDDFDIDRDQRHEGERDRQTEDENLHFGSVTDEPRRRTLLPFALLAVVLVAAIAGVLFFLRPGKVLRPGGEHASATPVPPSSLAADTAPSPSEPALDLPTLAESDAFVREQAKSISAHPQFGSWLAARGLVRTLTVTVQNVAEGRSPAPFLAFLTPTERFKAIQKGGRLVADPKSHAAYDDFADGVAALDAAECARVYRVLAPLFGAAYAELGYPANDFPAALARALETIRTTPAPDGEIALQRGRIFLEFADPRLEALSFAQKHLLRMGPRNLRLLQGKAAELAQALEAPAAATQR